MGAGLSLSTDYKNTHSIPLMRNKNILNEYIHSMFFISDNQVFKIKELLNLHHLKNEENLEFLQGKLETFKQYNLYINDNFKIISDSVYYNFFK
jgi:hypothetical protein